MEIVRTDKPTTLLLHVTQREAKDLLQFIRFARPKTHKMPRRTALCDSLEESLSEVVDDVPA